MRYAKGFKAVVMTGVVVNVVLCAIALVAPGSFLGALGFDPAYPDIWVRFSALLLLLLSIFYVPGALDLDRYRLNAWFHVLSRSAGVVFFTVCVVLLGFERRFLLFALIDLPFALLSGLLLALAVRGPTRRAPEAARLHLRKGVA